MGLLRGAVFHLGGGARKQPIKQLTEMPTSNHGLHGPFPSLMGRFLTLVGRFAQRVSNAALANAALVLSSKNREKYSKGGQRRIINPKSLGLSAAVRE